MPKVNIREIDNTGSEQQEFLENIVLMPGVIINEYDEQGVQTENTVDGLYEDSEEFINKVEQYISTYPQAETNVFIPTDSEVTSYFTVEGKVDSNETIGTIEYEDRVLDKALKLETDTKVSFTTTVSGTLTLISGGVKPATSIGIDGKQEALTDNKLEIKLEAGTHEITKNGSTGNIFVIDFTTDTVEAPGYKNDLGFIMAIYLLKSGLPVQYFGAYNEGEDPTYTQLSDLYKVYEDRGKYDIRFVTPGGLRSAAAIQAALECAGNRGDAAMLCSAPNTLTEVDDVDTWIQENLGSICGTQIPRKGTTWGTYAGETYGRYGAHFSPDFITSITVDKYEYKNITLPGYFDYLVCYSYYTQNFNDWYAIAGSIRGVTRLPKLIPLIKYGDVDVDILEPRDGGKYLEEGYENDKHIATNAICNIRPYGNIIWGNRTMHPLSAPENGSSPAIQLTASSFLNIRNLCIDIKKTLYRAARRYTFEPNSDVLWINFKSQITPLLEKMLSDQGIRGYQIIKLRTNKKAVLVARIKIVPIEAVEDFDLTVELADTIEVNE